MTAPFGATWGTLIEQCEKLSEDATLITPLSSKRFSISDVRQSRVIIKNIDIDDTQPLAREQFATLAEQ